MRKYKIKVIDKAFKRANLRKAITLAETEHSVAKAAAKLTTYSKDGEVIGIQIIRSEKSYFFAKEDGNMKKIPLTEAYLRSQLDVRCK